MQLVSFMRDGAPGFAVEPRKIVCVGLNYRSHVLEAGHEIPKISETFDFHRELAVVIGKGGRHVPAGRRSGSCPTQSKTKL